MALAGGLGAEIDLAGAAMVAANERDRVAGLPDAVVLFSESNTRFLCEVRPDAAGEFEACFAGLPCGRVGTVVDHGRLEIGRSVPSLAERGDGRSAAPPVISTDLASLKEAWQQPLRW
jgi:phosphoribosylformylglycinamidine synthase